MPRRRRMLIAGGAYHVYARGVRKLNIFHTDEDREDYLTLLAEVVKDRGWRVMTYCLMGNHVHLLVETPEPDLDKGMWQVHMNYARRFNQRHGFVGHLFERRYGAALAVDESRVVDWSSYIALNPVTAGICEEPEDWHWSAHPAIVGGGRRPEWLDVDRLLAHFTAPGKDPRGRYADMVRARQILDRAGVAPIVPPDHVLKVIDTDELRLAA